MWNEKRQGMKKILIYGLSTTFGGVEAFILNYVNHMPAENCKIEFLVMDREPEYLKCKLLRSVEVRKVPSRTKNIFLYHQQINKIVKSGGYDVIWCNFCTLTDISLLKAGKKYGVPVRIAHSHNSQNMGGKLVMMTHLMNKKVVDRYATHFFACSEIAGEFMFGRKLLEHKNYRMIHNAIDTKRFAFNEDIRKKVRAELNIENKIVIGHVGRFHFQKNHRFLVKLFQEFHWKYPNSVLLLVGEGGLLEEIQQLTEKLELSEDILFLGARTDVNELMQGMDLFLLPSVFEGFPVVAVEAQASGLPCVFSSVITDQTKITDLVKFVDLDAPVEHWIDAMETALVMPRRERQKEIEKAGYDITGNAEQFFDNIV